MGRNVYILMFLKNVGIQNFLICAVKITKRKKRVFYSFSSVTSFEYIIVRYFTYQPEKVYFSVKKGKISKISTIT